MNDDVQKALSLYSNIGWKKWFSKIRFWDAPYIELEHMIPQNGNILDIGCGEGVFTNYLAIRSKKRNLIGIDADNQRITHAQEASIKLSNATFIEGDVTKLELPSADIIIMVHVLHHLSSFFDQVKLIKQCKKKLKSSGKLIIVEVEPKASFKYFVTWLTDHFLVPLLFEHKLYSPIYFRKGKEWKKVLKRDGFNCNIINAEQNHPFTHIILECQKS